MLHLMGHGKVLSTSTDDLHFAMNWMIEILAYPAVNCFVLISGFVGYRTGNPLPKTKNIISLWFTVLFYSVSICLLLFAIYPHQVSHQEIAKSFFPILKNQYWFFTCYFGMFLLSPALNALLDTIDRSTCFRLGVLLAAIFSVSTLFGDSFRLSNGYTVLWFLLLYFLGATLKKSEITTKYSPWMFFLLSGASFLLTYLCKLSELQPTTPITAYIAQKTGYIVSYTSPTVLLTAIGAVCLFSRFSISKVLQKAITFFAPTAFSVYLIHDHPIFRRLIMKGRFSFFNVYSPILTILSVISCAIVIFLLCSLIDKVRLGLFRLCLIDRLAEWLSMFPIKIKHLYTKK